MIVSAKCWKKPSRSLSLTSERTISEWNHGAFIPLFVRARAGRTTTYTSLKESHNFAEIRDMAALCMHDNIMALARPKGVKDAPDGGGGVFAT